MNQLAGQPVPEREQRLIDRLVDGELSDSDRRRFLQSLDDDPTQWRQVALGFIESQCCAEACEEITSRLTDGIPCGVPLFGHQESFGEQQSVAAQLPVPQETPLSDSELVRVATPVEADRQVGKQKSGLRDASETMHRRVLRYVPVVACVAVAFTLGFIAQSRWSEWADRASQRLPSPRTVGSIPVAPVATHLSNVNNTVGGKPEMPLRTVNLPLVRGSKSTNSWLKQSEGVVSPELEESFFRHGYLVSEKKRVYPVQLKDGRRIHVPVKEIELKFIGNRGYQ